MKTQTGGSLIDDSSDILESLNFRRRVQIVGLVVVVIAAAFALLSRAIPELSFGFWGPLAAVLLVAKLVLLAAGWRCPRCRASLGSNYWPRYCQGCGVDFQNPSEK